MDNGQVLAQYGERNSSYYFQPNFTSNSSRLLFYSKGGVGKSPDFYNVKVENWNQLNKTNLGDVTPVCSNNYFCSHIFYYQVGTDGKTLLIDMVGSNDRQIWTLVLEMTDDFTLSPRGYLAGQGFVGDVSADHIYPTITAKDETKRFRLGRVPNGSVQALMISPLSF
jgi:hypothetical protein